MTATKKEAIGLEPVFAILETLHRNHQCHASGLVAGGATLETLQVAVECGWVWPESTRLRDAWVTLSPSGEAIVEARATLTNAAETMRRVLDDLNA